MNATLPALVLALALPLVATQGLAQDAAPADPTVAAVPDCSIDFLDGEEGARMMLQLGCKGVDYMTRGTPTRVSVLWQADPAAAIPRVGSGQGQPLIDNPDTREGASPTMPATAKGYDYGDLRGNVMYRAGMADAMQGLPMNSVYVTNLDYLRGYADGQRRR